MGSRKTSKVYYFSVEGETEEWYLKHLQSLINSSEKAGYSVKFIVKIKKDPREMVKAYPFINKTTINHICDTESNSDEHTKIFRTTLDNMRSACSMGKKVSYRLGYSNFAFDLWIALHKGDCNTQLAAGKQYLKYLNSGFKEHFISMNEYKEEDNFNHCLEKIKLEDVFAAIERAEKIMSGNAERGYKPVQYKKFTYYSENPSLSVHEIIADILKQCKLLPKKQTA